MVDAKYLAEIRKRDSAELPETAAPVFRDRHVLLAEVDYQKILVSNYKRRAETAESDNAAKDQQIATLEKALMQAIREGHTDLSPASHQKLFDHYVQVQEQITTEQEK